MKKLLTVFLIFVASALLGGNSWALDSYIPHITSGAAEWTDYLQVNNNTSFSQSFTLTMYNSDGSQVYSQSFTVDGLSHSQIDLKTLAPSAETGNITYANSGLAFRVSYQHQNSGIAEFKAMDTLCSKLGFYFSNFASFTEWKGAALANFGSSEAQVTLYAIGGSSQGTGGSILATHQETIAPRSKVVGTHASWFGLDLNQLEGIIAVTDSASLCGLAIAGDSNITHLLFTPAVPVVNFDSETSEWDLTCAVDLSGNFSVTADLILTIRDNTFSAQVTTKQIGGQSEIHVATLEGPFDGTTGTIENQVFTITVGSTTETITLNGTFDIDGTSLSADGSFTTNIQGGTYPGTFTANGTKK